MENVQLNYESIIKTLTEQIETLKSEILTNDIYTENPFWAEISPIIKDLKFYVYNEQAFVKDEAKMNPNAVHVAVRFGKASTNFGSSVLNISLIILGTANKVKPVQMFFSAFATNYTTRPIDIEGIGTSGNSTQIWVTPSVQTNFNDVSLEFRNLFEVSGTLIIGNNTVTISSGIIRYIYGDGLSEDIPFISWQDNYQNNLSPQPYGNTKGFAKSETNFSVYSFSFSTYLLDTQLTADCMHMRGFTQKYKKRSSDKLPNDDFTLIITFSNGYTNSASDVFFKTFKLVSSGFTNNLGEIPTFTASFTH